MGDIYKNVKICGLTDDGRKLGCETVKALIDTGTSMTVISKKLADRIQASDLAMSSPIEGRMVGLRLTGIELVAPGCKISPVVVGADDRLAARAGNGAEVILGHDYLQRSKGALRYDGSKHEVACDVKLVRVQRRRRKKAG